MTPEQAREKLAQFKKIESLQGGEASVMTAFRLITSNPANKHLIAIISAAQCLPVLEQIVKLFDENAKQNEYLVKTANAMLQASLKMRQQTAALRTCLEYCEYDGENFDRDTSLLNAAKDAIKAALSDDEPEQPKPGTDHKYELD